ncbi:221_t:CDS:2, partial [Entrophospora sp. SA101]
MSNSSRLDLGVWLRPRIYPLTEDKTSSTYYYHLLSYDRNSNEPYQSVSRHQFLLHVGRFFLANEPNNFRHVSRTLLSSVIGDLVRSASGSELLKATVYCRYFNALIREDNRANQIDRNRHPPHGLPVPKFFLDIYIEKFGPFPTSNEVLQPLSMIFKELEHGYKLKINNQHVWVTGGLGVIYQK